jgi:hypothetical protein
MQGGEHKNVPLRSVVARENSRAGGFLGDFYKKCNIAPNQEAVKYNVLAMRGVSSGYVCAR